MGDGALGHETLDPLDALAAASEHHKLLFEDDRVRVLDTLIRPGDRTAVHTHQWPSVHYVLSWSDFLRYDANDIVLFDSRSMAVKPEVGTALPGPPLPLHSLLNIGDADLHVISVELKRG